MKIVTLVFDGELYNYKSGNDLKMGILGLFLASDVGCTDSIFKAWALADKKDPSSRFSHTCGSNTAQLEEINDDVVVLDRTSRENPMDGLRMKRWQFIQLLDDWENKVCKRRPKEVIIKHENGEFIIETKNE